MMDYISNFLTNLYYTLGGPNSSVASQYLYGLTSSRVLGWLIGGLIVLGVWVFLAKGIGKIYFPLKTVARWKMYEKAGIDGWKSLIPIYRRIQDFRVAWSPEWGVVYYLVWIFLVLINLIGFKFSGSSSVVLSVVTIILVIFQIIVLIIFTVKLSVVFGHSVGWAFGLIFFGSLFFAMIAFGKSKYNQEKFRLNQSFQSK